MKDYTKNEEVKNRNKAKKNIKIGAINSKIFVIFFDLFATLCKLTPKKDEAKITVAIPKLILKVASITAKYVFNKKA